MRFTLSQNEHSAFFPRDCLVLIRVFGVWGYGCLSFRLHVLTKVAATHESALYGGHPADKGR
jgi:hypothetical protein